MLSAFFREVFQPLEELRMGRSQSSNDAYFPRYESSFRLPLDIEFRSRSHNIENHNQNANIQRRISAKDFPGKEKKVLLPREESKMKGE